MSQFFDDAIGLQAVMQERDRSQLPLWPELELEFEQVLADQEFAPEDCESSLQAPEAGNIFAQMETSAEPQPGLAAFLIPVPRTPVLAAGEHRLEGRSDGFVDEDAEFGQRLRAARERLELEREEVARRTHITTAVIKAIEDGRFEKLGATVFARGYLRSYARAVELPDAVVGVWESRAQRVTEHAPVPSLAATSPRRSSRQMASPIVYTLLTALIAVPAYYGVRQAQRSPLLRPDASIERAAAGTPATATTAEVSAGRSAAVPSGSIGGASPVTAAETPHTDAWHQPVMASLTPIMGPQLEADNASAPLDLRKVRVRLSAPSWIEISAADGKIIERGLLPAGTDRAYSVPRSTRLRVGNVRAVELRADDKVIDLAPYARANVATLTLDEAGGAHLQ